MSRLPYSPSKHAQQILGATAEGLLSARGHAERLNPLFHRSSVPMVMVDDRRRYVEVNRPARLMARLTLAEMRRLRIDDLTPSDELPIMEAVWARMLENGCVAGPRELAGREGGPLEIVYWGMANALPGLHLYAFAPVDWSEDELGLVDASVDLPLAPLTPREREVLQLAAEGMSGPGIAERLGVSPTTVKTHSSNVYEKLGVSSRSAAVAMGLRLGLIA
jgi:ATP/maltotriose-dependent transcriptional regulator MalT